MIKQVHFEKFKCLDNVTVDLAPLTVLVGPNGAGKTSILKGMDLLARAATPSSGDVDGTGKFRFGHLFSGRTAAHRLASGFGREPTNMVLEMTAADGVVCRLNVSMPAASLVSGPDLGHVKDDGAAFRLSVTGAEPATIPTKEEDVGLTLSKLRDPKFGEFTSTVYLQLSPRDMCKTWVSSEERPRLRPNGSGLSSVLAWMKGAAEEQLESITRDLAAIVPGVKRIRTFRARIQDQDFEAVDIANESLLRPIQKVSMGDRFAVEFDNDISVPADLLSEGTVLALGILTKLHDPDDRHQSRVILLDDVERGLHLEAQARLVRVLRELIGLHPGLQVVFTTQSPYLLSQIEPSEVRVLALDKQRHTHVRALTEHPDFDKWKYGTQTGELWAALGESWVAAE